ncbi:MAG TPA: molybdopterin-dependent oxidoreductase [Candidatus Sulfotelmatobacter sp.]|nr:molybdopterin-dependent oxidoreductase [Candidatus Sulfotelmatobacter sp.]
MSGQVTENFTRREFLQKSGTVATGLFFGFGDLQAYQSLRQEEESFRGGRLIDTVDFVDEGQPRMDAASGSELDGRLYTNLSTLTTRNSVIPTERFYIRTRASDFLPNPKLWTVTVNGLVERPIRFTVQDLRKMARPMGAHLIECAGNVRLVRFGMISVANWSGVPLFEILSDILRKDEATRILVSGYDRYAEASTTSVPGASWIFSWEELRASRTFLATEMNGLPLTKDHGAPVRLLAPGWYGCACIKWVNTITVVDNAAKATSQMQEYATRTHQNGIPQLAMDYQPAVIDQAAMPIRVERWLVDGKLKYRVVGVLWGGSRPIRTLLIRFNPEESYVPVNNWNQTRNDPWTIWSHIWSPKTPGAYLIRLAVKDPGVRARRLDSGYYVRAVYIAEI